jgi:hypothetical protein
MMQRRSVLAGDHHWYRGHLWGVIRGRKRFRRAQLR